MSFHVLSMTSGLDKSRVRAVLDACTDQMVEMGTPTHRGVSLAFLQVSVPCYSATSHSHVTSCRAELRVRTLACTSSSQAFVEEHQISADEQTWQVCERLNKPHTACLKCCYFAMLAAGRSQRNNEPWIGEQNVFVSHTWWVQSALSAPSRVTLVIALRFVSLRIQGLLVPPARGHPGGIRSLPTPIIRGAAGTGGVLLLPGHLLSEPARV